MFLVENLPKESSESASEPLGKFLSILKVKAKGTRAIVERKISSTIEQITQFLFPSKKSPMISPYPFQKQNSKLLWPPQILKLLISCTQVLFSPHHNLNCFVFTSFGVHAVYIPDFLNHCFFFSNLTGSSVMMHRRISAELSKRLKRPWTPSFCKKDNIGWSGTKPRIWHREVCVYF